MNEGVQSAAGIIRFYNGGLWTLIMDRGHINIFTDSPGLMCDLIHAPSPTAMSSAQP